MKKLNFKGSALLQVLVLSALIATIVVVLLKFAITRTSNMVQTKNVVASEMAVQACLSALNDEEYQRISLGQAPYFEGNDSFPCSYGNYLVNITKKDYTNNQEFDHKSGVVRQLEFSIVFYNNQN